MQYLSGGKKLQLSRDIVQQFLLYSALGLSSHAIVNIEWRLFQVVEDATPSSSLETKNIQFVVYLFLQMMLVLQVFLSSSFLTF